MAITAAMVKELRERTGAGMMDCKKALTEANGDLDVAIEELRIKGAAAAQKKAGRIAAEGAIFTAQNSNTSSLVEINCETDFVAKDDSFTAFANHVANVILQKNPADLEALASMEIESEVTIESARQELITKIGENISIRRFERLEAENGVVSCYLHGTRIGVLVKLQGGTDELGRDLAMHIAASNPLCVSEAEMDPAVLEKEKEIFMAQAADSGKPADIIEKIVGGRIKKFLKKNTLTGQPFVKNPDQNPHPTVAELLSDADSSVDQMVRYEVGEGLEKRSDNFVAEVMAQAGA